MPHNNNQTPRGQRKEEAPPAWQNVLLFSLFSMYIAAILSFIVGFILNSEFGWNPRIFLILTVLFWIIFLPESINKSPSPGAYAFFNLLARVFGWLFINLLPVLMFYYVSKYTLVNGSLFFQGFIFVLWGVLLAVLLLLISTESRREGMFKSFQEFGRFSPFIYSFNVLFIATAFFSSVTYVLVEHGLLKFSESAEGDVSLEALSAFYLWHFVEALPLLKLNETLHWEKPLTYDSVSVGLVLLMFKVTVIAPVFAAFAGYWAYIRRERPEDE